MKRYPPRDDDENAKKYACENIGRRILNEARSYF